MAPPAVLLSHNCTYFIEAHTRDGIQQFKSVDYARHKRERLTRISNSDFSTNNLSWSFYQRYPGLIEISSNFSGDNQIRNQLDQNYLVDANALNLKSVIAPKNSISQKKVVQNKKTTIVNEMKK